MKKLLSLFGAMTLTASSSAYTTTSIKINDSIKENQNKTPKVLEEKIDWDTMSIDLNSQFENIIENNKNNKTIKTFSEISREEEMFEISKERSFYYLNRFKEESATSEMVFNTLKKEIPEFKKEFDNNIQINNYSYNFKKISNNLATNFGYGTGVDKIVRIINVSRWSELRIKKIKDLNDTLDILSVGLSGFSILAAIAAAGFWSGSWFFGISIPWAIACTALSIVLTGAATGIGIYTTITRSKAKSMEVKNKNLKDSISDTIEAIDDIASIIYDTFDYVTFIFNLVRAIMITVQVGMSAGAWAFPPILTLSTVLLFAISLIDVIFDYK